MRNVGYKECLRSIQRLGQPEPAESYLVNRLDALTVPGAPPMDLVVMCNVLHEIPVRQWLRYFSALADVLAADAHLVILEDQLPPVGELPHANGYVLLDKLALMELFGSRDAVKVISEERDARLTAYAIPKPFLRKATADTIRKALEKVKRTAQDQLRQLRDDASPTPKRSFQEGRRHAHYALLYTNAQLALEEYQMP